LEEVTGGGGEEGDDGGRAVGRGAAAVPNITDSCRGGWGREALGDRWRVGGKMAVASPRPQAVGNAGWTREIGGAQEESDGEWSTIGNDDLFVSANIFIGTRN
jgi:hypothetical protein